MIVSQKGLHLVERVDIPVIRYFRLKDRVAAAGIQYMSPQFRDGFLNKEAEWNVPGIRIEVFEATQDLPNNAVFDESNASVKVRLAHVVHLLASRGEKGLSVHGHDNIFFIDDGAGSFHVAQAYWDKSIILGWALGIPIPDGCKSALLRAGNRVVIAVG